MNVPLPEGCQIAFKEWSGVCRALETGRQTVLLRKGGIAEEGGRFQPEHAVFWLYPTHLHEAQQGLKGGGGECDVPAGPPGTVLLGALASVSFLGYAGRLEELEQIRALHRWTDETIERRFHYRAPGLWVLGVRVYRHAPAWPLPATPAHAGCKSWVPLEEPVSTAGLQPVLDDEAFARALAQLESAIPGAKV